MKTTLSCAKAVLSCVKELIKSDTLGIDEILRNSRCKEFSESEILDCLNYLQNNHFIIARFIYADDKIYDIAECKITLKGRDLCR